MTLVEIRLTWFEFCRFLKLADILNQNLTTTGGEQVFLVWIEFKCSNWGTIVNLGSADASLAQFLLLRGILWHNFAGTPECYSTILHAARNDTLFVKLVDPV